MQERGELPRLNLPTSRNRRGCSRRVAHAELRISRPFRRIRIRQRCTSLGRDASHRERNECEPRNIPNAHTVPRKLVVCSDAAFIQRGERAQATKRGRILFRFQLGKGVSAVARDTVPNRYAGAAAPLGGTSLRRGLWLCSYRYRSRTWCWQTVRARVCAGSSAVRGSNETATECRNRAALRPRRVARPPGSQRESRVIPAASAQGIGPRTIRYAPITTCSGAGEGGWIPSPPPCSWMEHAVGISQTLVEEKVAPTR
jgi:hypothetical protein